MRTKSPAYRVGVVAFLVIATLIVVQPLGVFWHFVHDHRGEHSSAARADVGVHLAGGEAPDHDADHCHMWMTPADTAVMPRVDQPRAVTALVVFEHVSRPTVPLFPPFSPPRA